MFLSIFSKVFERQVFNTLFNFFLQNKLFTAYQSGFIPADSCVSELLSITHLLESLVWNLYQIENGLENLLFSQNNLSITTILP